MLAILAKVPLWCWILLVCLLVMTGMYIDIRFLTADLAKEKAQNAAYVSVQQSQLSTIATLTVANHKFAADAQSEAALSKTYLQAEIDYANQQQAKAKKAQSSLDAIYAQHPESKAWSVLPVDLSVSSELRANAGR